MSAFYLSSPVDRFDCLCFCKQDALLNEAAARLLPKSVTNTVPSWAAGDAHGIIELAGSAPLAAERGQESAVGVGGEFLLKTVARHGNPVPGMLTTVRQDIRLRRLEAPR